MTGVETNSFTTFGVLLKYLRRRARLTQRELGIAVGYSEAQIARLESGTRLPDLAAVKAHFIEALGLQQEPKLAERLVLLASRSHSAASVDAGTVTTPASPMGTVHLPAPLTSFIGREHDVASALRLLRRADVRLVTLLGPPGIGKTRLAIEIARAASAVAGQPVRAVTLWAAAEGVYASIGFPRPALRTDDYRARIDAVRGQLDEQALAAAKAAGRAMGFEQAIEYALADEHRP